MDKNHGHPSLQDYLENKEESNSSINWAMGKSLLLHLSNIKNYKNKNCYQILGRKKIDYNSPPQFSGTILHYPILVSTN